MKDDEEKERKVTFSDDCHRLALCLGQDNVNKVLGGWHHHNLLELVLAHGGD